VTRLCVYSRSGCGLCEELLEALRSWAQRRGLVIEILDVDSDPVMKRRYGHRIPVLLLDGEPVCHGSLDVSELERRLASEARPS